VQLAPWQLDALDAFWERAGVRSAAGRKRLVALASTVLLFRSPAELQTRLAALRAALWHAAGIRGADTGGMVARYPRLLCGALAYQLPLKLQALQAGLPGVDLQRLLERCPQLLSLEPHATVLARAHALLRLLGPGADVLRLAELHPPLLTVSVPRTVEPALGALREALGGDAARAAAAAAAAPRLLTSVPATLRRRAALLEQLAPGALAAARSPAVAARLLSASEAALQRIAYLRGAGEELSPLRAVSLSAAAFAARFPGWAAWEAGRAEGRVIDAKAR